MRPTQPLPNYNGWLGPLDSIILRGSAQLAEFVPLHTDPGNTGGFELVWRPSPSWNRSLQPPAMQSDSTTTDASKKAPENGLYSHRLLVLSFALIALGTAAAGLWNPFWEHQSELFAAIGVASAGWAFAVFSAKRVSISVRWIVAGAILLRVVVLCGDPGLSDDVNRYVWEGGLVADQISPYAHAPDAEVYAERREEYAAIYAGLNNTSISAAYPPFIEEVFGVLVWGAGMVGERGSESSLLMMRVFFTLCDLLVLWPLLALLKRFGRPSSLAVVWAWCPLMVLEFAGSGHFDSLGVLTLMGALALLSCGDRTRAWHDGLGAVLTSASIFIKLLPLCLIPFMLRREGRLLRLSVLFGASLLWLLPFAFWQDGLASFDRGLTEYGTRWEGFNFVYSWIESSLDDLFGGDRDRSFTDPRLMGRGIIGLVWCAYLLFLVVKKCEPVHAVGQLVALFLVLTPTLHPWYLAWILPFAALRPSWHWLWVLATGVFLYAPLEVWNAAAEWSIPSWTWPVVALPFFTIVVANRLMDRDSEQ